MKRILVTGVYGQLGQELQKLLLLVRDLTVIGVGRDRLDLTKPEQIQQQLQTLQPDIIINTAAYTAVDKAESEVELANIVNGIAPTLIAREAKQLGANLIHLSTDYVFDGNGNRPYTEDCFPNPVGVYGKTKLAGEQGVEANCDRALVLRTAWVYGAHGRGNFVKTMLRLGKEKKQLRVVCDQVGSPTWAYDLAIAIAQLISLPTIPAGIYHYTNSGVTSWYDFAVAIFEEAEQIGFPLLIEEVVPITTAEYPTPAVRPPYSVLNCQKITKLLKTHPPQWRQSLRKMLNQLYTHNL